MKKLILFLTLIILSYSIGKTAECIQVTITRWPKGIIPYYFDNTVTRKQKLVVKMQMLAWERKCSKITFMEVEPPKTKSGRLYKYLISTHSSAISWSTLGYSPSPRCRLAEKRAFSARYREPLSRCHNPNS